VRRNRKAQRVGPGKSRLADQGLKERTRDWDRAMWSFGLVSDIQYVDAPDSLNFDKTVVRRYRHSLHVVRNAVEQWNKVIDDGQVFGFVAQLGDLVDGKNSIVHPDEGDRQAAFDMLLEMLSRSPTPRLVNVIGNHDLVNFKRKKLESIFSLKSGYYDFVPFEGWRVLVLDCYDVSVMGVEEGSPEYCSAEAILNEHNPNPWKQGSSDFYMGLEGPAKRYVPFNGAVGSKQMEWLRERLDFCANKEERVIILSHLPILPEAQVDVNRYKCLPWNYREILDIFEQSSARIAAVFAGHDHLVSFFNLGSLAW